MQLNLPLQVHATILSAIMDVMWGWKSEVSSIMEPSTAPAGSILEFDIMCFGASFQAKVYFLLAYPVGIGCIMYTLAVILAKCSEHSEASFKSLGNTLRLFASVGMYTFGASIISDLFISFPCFDGADDQRMMVHDPTTKCYGHGVLMVLSLVGMCFYGAATAYVLGYSFWRQKDIIHHPGSHEESVVNSTYQSFGFLFYGVKSTSVDDTSYKLAGVMQTTNQIFFTGK